MTSCAICQSSDKTLNLFWHQNQEMVLCGDCGCHFPRVFKVPSFNLPALNEKLNKLGRRAKRLDLPVPTYQEIKEPERKVQVRVDEISGERHEAVYLLHTLLIDASIAEVKLNGFEFVCTVSHSDEGNVLRKVSEREVPLHYRTSSAYCMHCQTDRYRKETFVLFHEEQGFKQVGRNCLQDYLGANALDFAARAEYLRDLLAVSGSMEDDGGFGGGGFRSKYEALERLLEIVSELISLEGWMSRSRARQLEGIMATADLAYLHLHSPPRFKRIVGAISEASVEQTKQIIEWASELPDNTQSDYLWNLRCIARRGVYEPKDLGTAASMVSAWLKEQARLRRKELEAKRAEISQYVGKIGQRILLKVYVEKVLRFENQFGTTHLHIMSDDNGNSLVWWSSSTVLEAGKETVIYGTIKKHELYGNKQMKQTTLSRCTEVVLKEYWTVIECKVASITAPSEAEAKKILKLKFNLTRWPKGLPLLERKDEGEAV
jgi:hypothetical protein